MKKGILVGIALVHYALIVENNMDTVVIPGQTRWKMAVYSTRFL